MTKADVEEIDEHPERLTFSLPTSEVDRMTVLYDLLFLMKIDGDVADEEVKLVRELGMRLGFRIGMVNEFIQTISQYVGREVPDEALLNIIRKYMN